MFGENMNDLSIGQRVILTKDILYIDIIPHGSVGYIMDNPYDLVYKVRVCHGKESVHLTLHRKMLIAI